MPFIIFLLSVSVQNERFSIFEILLSKLSNSIQVVVVLTISLQIVYFKHENGGFGSFGKCNQQKI